MYFHPHQNFHMSFLAVLLLGTGALVGSTQTPNLGDWMFLAANITSKGPDAFPATLFVIDSAAHRLALVREVVPASRGVYFVRSGEGVLSIGSPHISPDRLSVVQRVGHSVRTVDIALPRESVPTDNVLAVAGKTQLELLRMVRVPSTPPVTEDVAVSLTPTQKLPQIEHSRTIKQFSHFEIGGATAGFFGEWDGFQTDLLPAGISGLDWPGIPKIIAPPPDQLRDLQPTLTSVACANKRFIAIIVARDHKVIETASQLTAFVFDRNLNKWQSLSFEGSSTRLRLFDKWLAAMTITAQGSATQKAQVSIPPATSELKSPSKSNREYEVMPGTEIPGKLVLVNLETGERINLTTGKANSEILSVKGGSVLYRVDDQLLLAQISGTNIGAGQIIATDERASDIHWVLEDIAPPRK